MTDKPHRSLTISPDQLDAVIFDMDGVVTRTATVHARAWKEVFDELLKERQGDGFKPFDIDSEYRTYVDGKPRYDGVQSFLESRNINLPWGRADDKPSFKTVCAIGNMKNRIFLKHLKEEGVEPYDTTVDFIKALKTNGIKVGVITASNNGRSVLKSAHLLEIFDTIIDGKDAHHLGLRGKPAPDVFLKAAETLSANPDRAAIVEDAAAGVEAGKNGKFALVIGLNHNNHRQILKEHGATVVVDDLAEVEVENGGQKHQIAHKARRKQVDLASAEKDWLLTYKDLNPDLEGRRETLCALGNGYFVSRGAAPESTWNEIHYPGTYLAGAYNRLITNIGGVDIEHEDLVNMPNWQYLTFKIDTNEKNETEGKSLSTTGDGSREEWFDLSNVEVLDYKQTLNLRQGVLYRVIDFRDSKGRETSLLEKRFVHMHHFHLAGLEMKIIPRNWSGMLTIRSALDGRVLNAGTKSFSALS